MTEMLAARNVTRETVLAARLEVAASLWAKFKGLMGRSTLDADAGLWLPDSNGIHMMFMRFPIDVVFVGRRDADGICQVVSVHRGPANVDRPRAAGAGAHGVLELPVGTIERTGTQVGDAPPVERRIRARPQTRDHVPAAARGRDSRSMRAFPAIVSGLRP